MDLKARAKKLKQDIPVLFLSLKDKDTPLPAKLLAAVTVSYALSPIDLIPDFIPVLGYLDDLLVLPALIALTIRLIPAAVWEKNRQLAATLRQEKKPKRWYYAIPIVLLWALVLALILWAIFF